MAPSCPVTPPLALLTQEKPLRKLNGLTFTVLNPETPLRPPTHQSLSPFELKHSCATVNQLLLPSITEQGRKKYITPKCVFGMWIVLVIIFKKQTRKEPLTLPLTV